MNKAIAGICLFVMTSGCVFINKSPDDLPFAQLSSLKEVEGSYQNKGAGDGVLNPPMLSEIIWTHDQSVNHQLIHAIAVRAVDLNTLEIKALTTGGEVLKTDYFICGKQFKFVNGRIYLRSGWHATLGPDDPIFGPKYEWVELGLDREGDGKYRSGAGVVGVAYLFFPVIGVGEEDVRFIKIK